MSNDGMDPYEVPQLLTVKQVMQRLNLSRSAVYVLMNRGDIPSVHLGGARRIPARGLSEYVARLVRQAQGPLCRVCGEPLRGIMQRSTKTYCSNTCKMRAQRRRNTDQLLKRLVA